MASSMTRIVFMALVAFVLLCGLASAQRSMKQEFLQDAARPDGK